VGKVSDGIDESLADWIAAQPMCFVAIAPLAADGRVTVSSHGHDSFSILGPHRVGWVDYTGSGVETIAHLRENGRICVDVRRLRPSTRHRAPARPRSVGMPGDPVSEEVASRHPDHASTRAVVDVDVELVSDSCGYGVPVMDFGRRA